MREHWAFIILFLSISMLARLHPYTSSTSFYFYTFVFFIVWLKTTTNTIAVVAAAATAALVVVAPVFLFFFLSYNTCTLKYISILHWIVFVDVKNVCWVTVLSMYQYINVKWHWWWYGPSIFGVHIRRDKLRVHREKEKPCANELFFNAHSNNTHCIASHRILRTHWEKKNSSKLTDLTTSV